jgi:hypothetical protein
MAFTSICVPRFVFPCATLSLLRPLVHWRRRAHKPIAALLAASRLILETAILGAPMFSPRPRLGQTGPKESDGLAALHAMDFSMYGVLVEK